MKINYDTSIKYWLKYYGQVIVEQCNYPASELISFHSWKSKEALFETPITSTVAIWTVKKKVV